MASLVGMLLVVAPTSAGAAWTTPVTLSAPGQDAFSPRVAVDAGGDAVFAWMRSDGSASSCCSRIKARTRSAGGTLGPVEALSAPGQNATGPQLAVDDGGKAVFAWTRFDGENWRVQARARSAAGALGPILTVSAAGEDAHDAQVSVDAVGNAVFTWTRFDGLNRRVQARARSASGALGPVQALSAAGEDADSPRVSVNPDGKAVFTWTRADSPRLAISGRVQARARSAAGALGPIQTLSTAGCCSELAVDDHGGAVFAWVHPTCERNIRSEGCAVIQARARSAAGTLSPIQDLSYQETCCDAGAAQVAVDPAGDAIFTFLLGAGYLSNPVVFGRARSAAGKLGPLRALRPSSFDSYQQLGAPQVAVDDTGNAVFTWPFSEDGSHSRIQALARSAAGTFGPVQYVSAPGRDAIDPQVAVDPSGDAVLAWSRFGGANWRIQAAFGP